MDSKLLLIKVITLLYKEAIIKDISNRSIGLVQEILKDIKIPETGAEFGGMKARIMQLKDTAEWMLSSGNEEPYERTGLFQRIRIAVDGDEGIYQAFELGMDGDETNTETILKQCLAIKSELNEYLANKSFKELAIKMYRKASFGEGPEVGTREFIQDMSTSLVELSQSYRGKQMKGMVTELFFDDSDRSAQVLEKAKNELSTDGALKFGQNAINEACHDHPGALRGEYWLVSALPHNYKSGLGLISFVDLALYNKPWMMDDKKKPLIMHISTENQAEQNALMVYEMLKERETGESVNSKGIDPVKAANYIQDRLSVNGYHTYMCRLDPSDTTVFDLQELIETKESEGYEVHAVILDYAAMLDKRGLAQGPTGSDLRDMHRRLRNFFSKRKTFCLTFHQLSPDAMRLQRMGVEDIVKEVAGRGYYDGTTKLLQEVDVDITIHLEAVGSDYYLSMQWAKHRKPKHTPKNLWYAAMKMNSVGGLIPDIDKDEPNFVRDLKPLREQQGMGDWYTQSLNNI